MSIGRNHTSLNMGAAKIPGAVRAIRAPKLAAGHGTQGEHPAAPHASAQCVIRPAANPVAGRTLTRESPVAVAGRLSKRDVRPARSFSHCRQCGGLWDGDPELLCSVCHDGHLGRDARESDREIVL